MSFRPEFLNRLDEILLFKPLNKQMIGNIVELIVSDLNKRLESKEIKVELSKEAVSKIIEGGYDPVYGARPLKRYIQKTVETIAAKLILAGKINQGNIISIEVENDELVGRGR